jgi:hypothetical protein
MTAILFILGFIALAALAPWFGADSRRLSTERRNDWYPTLPSTRP